MISSIAFHLILILNLSINVPVFERTTSYFQLNINNVPHSSNTIPEMLRSTPRENITPPMPSEERAEDTMFNTVKPSVQKEIKPVIPSMPKSSSSASSTKVDSKGPEIVAESKKMPDSMPKNQALPETASEAESHPPVTPHTIDLADIYHSVRLSEHSNSAIKSDSPAERVYRVGVKSGSPEIDAWLENWRLRVEKIGQAAYSGSAEGQLTAEVEVDQDGNVKNVSIIRPSNNVDLDEKTKSIIMQGQPYGKLPSNLSNLKFTRSWVFRVEK